MAPDEVQNKIQDLREEMFNLRFRNSMRQLDNSLKIRETRRDLARLITILTEHQTGVRPLGGMKKRAASAEKAADEAEATAAKKTTKTAKKATKAVKKTATKAVKKTATKAAKKTTTKAAKKTTVAETAEAPKAKAKAKATTKTKTKTAKVAKKTKATKAAKSDD
jgi:ribosomal protein L29